MGDLTLSFLVGGETCKHVMECRGRGGGGEERIRDEASVIPVTDPSAVAEQ